MKGISFMLALGFLLLILLLVIVCAKVYFRLPAASGRPIYRLNTKIGQGLDESTVNSFPNLLYAEAKKTGKNDRSNVFCPICLLDYEETDRLRLIPDCDHLFHLQCVDPWLRRHATCPLCRNSPASVDQPVASTEVSVALHASSLETRAPIPV